MKLNKSLTWVVIIVTFLAPSILLIWMAEYYSFNLQSLVPMTVGLSIMFGFEVIANYHQKEFIWSAISSTRDKMVFTFCLLIFWIAIGFAVLFIASSWWYGLLILLLGIGLSWLLFNFFMSQDAREALGKSTNIFSNQ
jgi:hypothetical protein